MKTHEPTPVPLFMVSVVLAGEIRKHGGTIREIHIRRSHQHQYAIAIVTEDPEAGADGC